MTLDRMATLRQQYHESIREKILAVKEDGSINIADKSNESSRKISEEITRKIGGALCPVPPSGQTAGTLFKQITSDYLERCFSLLAKFRPGPWRFTTERPISECDQYRHLAELDALVKKDRELQATLGSDYLIKPDIVVYRIPVPDEDIGLQGDPPSVATYTPFREVNHPGTVLPMLHASISCKWTMRSDRAQNTRTEALNLIRNRKGHTPHIVAVTAEPLPNRLASLALGTGDLDCVYHFALYELKEAIEAIQLSDALDMIEILIDGRRLRDISDLPFDLAI